MKVSKYDLFAGEELMSQRQTRLIRLLEEIKIIPWLKTMLYSFCIQVNYPDNLGFHIPVEEGQIGIIRICSGDKNH